MAFWTEIGKHEEGLINLLEDRDNLESRDNNWFNRLAHCKQSFRLMTYESQQQDTLGIIT